MPCLPFDIEEHIATRDLNQNTGMPEDHFMDRLGPNHHRASSTVGEGVAWTSYRNELGIELKRTIRKLDEKTTPDDKGGFRHFNEFSVRQEQTSYCTSKICLFRE